MSRSAYYNRSGEPIDAEEWLEEFRKDRRVAADTIQIEKDGAEVVVSTVFIGIDQNWRTDGPPIIFETMIFIQSHGAGNVEDWLDHCERYSTEEEALAGHERLVGLVKEALK